MAVNIWLCYSQTARSSSCRGKRALILRAFLLVTKVGQFVPSTDTNVTLPVLSTCTHTHKIPPNYRKSIVYGHKFSSSISQWMGSPLVVKMNGSFFTASFFQVRLWVSVKNLVPCGPFEFGHVVHSMKTNWSILRDCVQLFGLIGEED